MNSAKKRMGNLIRIGGTINEQNFLSEFMCRI